MFHIFLHFIYIYIIFFIIEVWSHVPKCTREILLQEISLWVFLFYNVLGQKLILWWEVTYYCIWIGARKLSIWFNGSDLQNMFKIFCSSARVSVALNRVYYLWYFFNSDCSFNFQHFLVCSCPQPTPTANKSMQYYILKITNYTCNFTFHI